MVMLGKPHEKLQMVVSHSLFTNVYFFSRIKTNEIEMKVKANSKKRPNHIVVVVM